MRGRYRRPPPPPGAPWHGEADRPEAYRAAGRKTCCKINTRSSRFSTERPRTYFATVCRKGQDNRVVPPRFSFPLHPLSSLLLVQYTQGDIETVAVKVTARLSDNGPASNYPYREQRFSRKGKGSGERENLFSRGKEVFPSPGSPKPLSGKNEVVVGGGAAAPSVLSSLSVLMRLMKPNKPQT